VLTCYIDGLAGDTATPDTTVRWFEMATLRPATVDRRLEIDEASYALAHVMLYGDTPASAAQLLTSGQVELLSWLSAMIDQVPVGEDAYQRWTAQALETVIGADGDTLESLSNQMDATATAAALDVVDANVDAVKTKTDLLGNGTVTVVSPVASGGEASVYQGDDYANADGRALAWSSNGWPDLTSATILFMVRAQTGALFSKAGTVVSAGGATQTVRVELTATETAALQAWPAESTLRLRATLASGGAATLVDSTLSVIEDVA
jgi:hypothetical protein